MTLAVFHDFPGLENGLTKFQDFTVIVVTLNEHLRTEIKLSFLARFKNTCRHILRRVYICTLLAFTYTCVCVIVNRDKFCLCRFTVILACMVSLQEMSTRFDIL